MFAWLSNPNAPAWVQAVGSVIAIFAAFTIPAWQRRTSLRDVASAQERRDKDHLKRLAAGLRAEVGAALKAARRQQSVIEQTLQQLKAARASGTAVVPGPAVPQGSMVVTDAVVYRQIAAEIGLLPPEVIRSTVDFYSFALEVSRIADSASTAEAALLAIQPLIPRLKVSATMLVAVLDKFEASSFALDANLRLGIEEIKTMAADADYPLEDVMRERGLQF